MAPHETALAYFGLISLGFVLGAYGTLIGAGGGFLLMPLLLMIYPHDHHSTLTAISLAVVFFNSFSGSAAYARLKRIDYKSGLMLAAATIPGAIIGATAIHAIPRRGFEAIFSVFMIGLAIFLVFRPKSDGSNPGSAEAEPLSSPRGLTRVFQSMNGISFEYHFNLLLGLTVFFFLGFIATFLGIGGGSLIVPSLSYLLNFPVFIATATSQFIVTIICFTATLTHIFHGAFHQGAHRTAALSMGIVIGAQFGAFLSNKIKGPWIIRGLAIAVAVVGVRMLIKVL